MHCFIEHASLFGHSDIKEDRFNVITKIQLQCCNDQGLSVNNRYKYKNTAELGTCNLLIFFYKNYTFFHILLN